MIEFFTFLNTCSAWRALVYLLFICIMTFTVLMTLSTIVRTLVGIRIIEVEPKEKEKQQLNG